MDPIITKKEQQQQMLLNDTSPISSHRLSEQAHAKKKRKKFRTQTLTLNFLLIDLIESFIVNALSTCVFAL